MCWRDVGEGAEANSPLMSVLSAQSLSLVSLHMSLHVPGFPCARSVACVNMVSLDPSTPMGAPALVVTASPPHPPPAPPGPSQLQALGCYVWGGTKVLKGRTPCATSHSEGVVASQLPRLRAHPWAPHWPLVQPLNMLTIWPQGLCMYRPSPHAWQASPSRALLQGGSVLVLTLPSSLGFPAKGLPLQESLGDSPVWVTPKSQCPEQNLAHSRCSINVG